MNSFLKNIIVTAILLIGHSSLALNTKFTCHVGHNFFYPSQKIEVDQAAGEAKLFKLDYNDQWKQSHFFKNFKCEEISNTQIVCQDEQQIMRLIFDKFNVRTEQDPRLISKIRFALKTDTLYVNYLEGIFELNNSVNLESAKCEIERF